MISTGWTLARPGPGQRRWWIPALWLLGLAGSPPEAAAAGDHGAQGNWGIDACLTAHVTPDERTRYLRLLSQSGVGWLRERGPSASFSELKAAGHRVVAFVQLPGLEPKQPGNALPEDLREVYNAARRMAGEYAEQVDAWEMVGEPDVGYCRDLPDRLAAYQKAVYLGIKAGAGVVERVDPNAMDRTESPEARWGQRAPPTRPTQPSTRPAPLVLMGALALPPGPWLERARRNDLLDYTDAYNFHFYGLADDLTGVIAAHARVAHEEATRGHREQSLSGRTNLLESGRSPNFHKILSPAPMRRRESARGALTMLPLWITECGLNATVPTDFLNPERRALQAAFTVSTARQALAAPEVALFMPFILVHKGDSHALTVTAEQPLPAWDAYARFTRDHPWPSRPVSRNAYEANPVVVQWMPDNATTLAHKVSGTYRFNERQPIRGEIRIFNFSAATRRGRLATTAVADLHIAGLPTAEFTVPPQGEVVFPITVQPGEADGYFRRDWAVTFIESTGAHSRAALAFEAWPATKDFSASPLPLRPVQGATIKYLLQPTDRVSGQSGPWAASNGLHVESLPDRDRSTRLRTWVEGVSGDPLRPYMAAAPIRGLPPKGFLRVVLDRPLNPNARVRVDLIDRKGQRFTIWENLGSSYFRPAGETWLNLEDFGVYFWGRCSPQPVFRPDQIEEIQLRFFPNQPQTPMEVAISVMQTSRP